MMVWWKENFHEKVILLFSSPDFLLTADELCRSNLTFLGGFGITLGFGVGLKRILLYLLFPLHIHVVLYIFLYQDHIFF